jgi:hypothetical protein
MSGLADQFAADAAAAPAAPTSSLAQQFAADASMPAKVDDQPTTMAGRRAAYEQFLKANGVTSPDASEGVARTAWHGLTSGAGYLAGLVRAGGVLASGGSLSDAADMVDRTHDAITYEPPASTGGGQIMSAMGAKYSPLTLLGKASNYLGDQTLSATGSPALATIADIGSNALATAGVMKAAGRAPQTVANLARKPVAAPRIDPSMSARPAPQLAANMEPVDLILAPKTAVPEKSAPYPASEPPAAKTVSTPANEPSFSDASRGVYATDASDVKGGLPEAEQQRRAAILDEIGISNVRQSAITGDANQAAIDFQTSRLKGSPAGDIMSQQLASEKQAITNYADRITQDTGGSALNDQAAKYARGGTILQPLEGLNEWFDQRTKALYDEAATRSQGVPTQLDRFRDVLGDDSLATNSDRVQMRQAIQAYAKKLNIIRDDGSVFSDGQQAETMRQYLNENWSPQNAGLVNKLKSALDEDVMSAAGEDVYGQARQLWALRKNTLDNPKGISQILDSSGPNGINRKVPMEKVADTISNMPVDQLSHIVDTLKNVPDELQPQAQAALSEIKAQYAHNIRDIGSSQQGQWNAKGVQKYLASNSARMGVVFSPEEMQRFATLNDAGNILVKDQSYPGAAAQHQNLLRAGVMQGISAGSGALGSAVGGPIGGALGTIAGGKLAGKFNDAATTRAVQKRIVRVKDMLPDSEQP